MEICRNCATELLKKEYSCTTCKYPTLGNDQDKASFIAKQEIDRGNVIFSKRDLKISKFVLAIIGLYFAFMAFIVIKEYGFSYAFIYIVMALAFGILFSQSSKAPQQTFFIGLCLMILYYLLDFFLAPELFFYGWLYKAFVIISLSIGYFRVRRSNQILKQNSYLASELGIKNL